MALGFLLVAGYSHVLSICRSICKHSISREHFLTSRIADVHLRINDVVGANVFSIEKNRCHAAFPRMKSNMFHKTNIAKRRKWFKILRTRFSAEKDIYDDATTHSEAKAMVSDQFLLLLNSGRSFPCHLLELHQ